MTWLRELWRWLKIRGQKLPFWFVWVSMHCNVRLVFDTSRRVKLYVGIVSVGRWLNLWCKPNSLLGKALNCKSNYCRKRVVRCLSSSSSDILSDVISCDRWPDSYQERNALKPHCMNTITNWDAWQVIPGRYDVTAITLSSALWS